MSFVPLSELSRPSAAWHVRRKETITASPARVWRALVDPAELARWWADRVEVDPRPGGRYAFGGRHAYRGAAQPGSPPPAGGPGEEKPGDYEIIRLEPEARLEFRWWLGEVETRVTFELSNFLELTEVVVTQTANRAPDWSPGPDEPSWWWIALPALRACVEKGQPDLRIDFEAMRSAPEIAFQVDVSTFPWVIWHKLTAAAELERWWARKAEVDLRPGGAFRLGLEGMGPRTVLEVDEGRRLAHDWTWKDGTQGRVEWSIAETDEDTRVAVRDCGPWGAALPHDGCLIYWGAMLLNLKQMSERGITPRDY